LNETSEPGKKPQLPDQTKLVRFETAVLPHLGAAYNLARWLTRNDVDAEDVVQESCLRAFRLFEGLRGLDARPWLLTIVRNTAYTWLERNRSPELTRPFDEETEGIEALNSSPEMFLVKRVDHELLKKALTELPVEFREVVILRELEGLSYKEIAGIADVPLGTVMSRLARARKQLRELLAGVINKEV
jgi:RNA polymerase sigma factor (sigma-70 family)